MKAFPIYFQWDPLWYSCDNCHGACSCVLLNFLDAVVHVTLRLPVTFLGDLTPTYMNWWHTIMGPVMLITSALTAFFRCSVGLSLNDCFLMPALSCSCWRCLKRGRTGAQNRLKNRPSDVPSATLGFCDLRGLEWIIFNQLQIVFKEIAIHDNPVVDKLIFSHLYSFGIILKCAQSFVQRLSLPGVLQVLDSYYKVWMKLLILYLILSNLRYFLKAVAFFSYKDLDCVKSGRTRSKTQEILSACSAILFYFSVFLLMCLFLWARPSFFFNRAPVSVCPTSQLGWATERG